MCTHLQTLKAAYREATEAHNRACYAYEQGRGDFGAIAASAQTLQNLRNLLLVEREAAQVRTR